MASLWIDVHLTGLANSMRARADARLHVARPFSRCITAKNLQTRPCTHAIKTYDAHSRPRTRGNISIANAAVRNVDAPEPDLPAGCPRVTCQRFYSARNRRTTALRYNRQRNLGKAHRSVIAWLRTGHTGFPISNGTCALHRRRNALIARPSASSHALRQTQGTSPPRIIVTRSTRSSPQPTIIYENSICSPPDAPSSPSSMRTPSGAPNPTGRTRSSRR